MKRFLLVVSLGAMVFGAGLGCATNRQPMIESAGIVPSTLQPGNTALITAEIDDPFDVVTRVEGTVEEDPSMEFILKDDGEPPDERANDDIWTMGVEVPFDAPPGDFHFTISAYNASGQVVVVRNDAGEAMPLQSKFDLTIDIPLEP